MGGAYLLFGILFGMVIGAIAVFIYDGFVIREINKIHETHYKDYKAQAENHMARLYKTIARHEAKNSPMRVDIIRKEYNCAQCPKESCPLWDPAKGCPLGKEPEGKDDGKDFHWYDD